MAEDKVQTQAQSEDWTVTDLTEPDKAPVFKMPGGNYVNAWGQTMEQIDKDEETDDSSENYVEPQDASSYEGWKKAELVQEVKNRNALRPADQKISTEGSAQDLIKRLEEDDEAQGE